MTLALRQLADTMARPPVVMAWLRVALLLVIAISELIISRNNHEQALFYVFLSGASVYAVITLMLARRSGRLPGSPWIYAAIDLIVVSGLLAASGAAFAHLRFVLSVLPVLAVFLGRPRHTLAALVASLGAYAVIEVIRRSGGEDPPIDVTLTQALDIIFQAGLVLLLSLLLARRSDQVSELADERRRLVTQALDAEERERRRLAYALHEGAVQSLLAAQLEFRRSSNGDGAAHSRGLEALASTVKQLREAIFELHPYTLEHGGLAATLEDLAAEQAQRTGMHITTLVSRDAEGIRDRLIFSLVREFMVNAVKHSGAEHVSVLVERIAEELLIEVEDDGRGFHLPRPGTALRNGHIGLASSKERVEGIGGIFTVRSDPGQGALIRAVLPARRDEESLGERADRPATRHDPTPKRRISDQAEASSAL